MVAVPQTRVKGELCWVFKDAETCYERGTVVQSDPHKGMVTVKLKSGETADYKPNNVLSANMDMQDGEPDNTFLRHLNEASLLHNLKSRYYSKDDGGVYTVTGHILIAINPYRDLKCYEEKTIKRYLGRPISAEPPHIFAIADRMYRLLVASGESQAIIVSGPSGSGKTETCKLVLRHLAYVTKEFQSQGKSKSSMELGNLLVMTNPLLEAFGNAETVLNKNSSRFGKFTQIHVSRKGAILGASIQTYLLESTRVVQHSANECSYHMYYQLVLGCPSADRAKFHLEKDSNKYPYLRSATGQATARRGKDAENFAEVVSVMNKIKIKDMLISAVFQTLSGLLNLGNIPLGENANGDSYVQDMNVLNRTSDLLCTNKALLQQGLISRTMRLKGSEMQIPLKPVDAAASRDALAKAVYGKLFSWIVSQINGSLMDQSVNIKDTGFLGILDIYGFENFEKNSLEQLFINFTNEQLHQHFSISLFKTEQEIYASEGIVWPGVEWEDNTDCLEVIAGSKANCVFKQLTEHSRLPKANDEEMTIKIITDNAKSPHLFAAKIGGGGRGKGQRLTNKEAFVISHFAGQVLYRTEGWLRKNTDTLHEDLQLCMSSSTSPLLSQLFSVGTINAITGGQKGGSKRAGFVADKYTRQLEELMRTLRSTHSHFVRCIKPNHKQEPNQFSDALVLDQLRSSGMVDAVRLLSAGFSTRVPFNSLEKQFKPLCPPRFQELPPALFCVALLTAFDLGRTDFLLGLTKAFFKSGKLAFVDALMSGSAKLDKLFFAKMAKRLAVWRLRRAISTVRCLLFLEAKMRRLRALSKLRISASIASMIGRSWVRRAKEIKLGEKVLLMQAYARGFLSRRQAAERSGALHTIQRHARGLIARQLRERVKIERENDRRKRAKDERDRKIRERTEHMQLRERDEADAQERANVESRKKAAASAKAAARADADDGADDDDDDYLSEGSDLIIENSDDEDGLDADYDEDDGGASGIRNPRQLLAATAALDIKGSKGMQVPGLKLANLSQIEDDEPMNMAGSLTDRPRKHPSMLQRMRNEVLGSMTPRSSRGGSSFFSARRMNSDGKRLLLSKTAKGSLVAAGMMRVSKRSESGWQERFVLVVGDVLFIFMLATQPELPLGLRLWPGQVICLNQSTLALPNTRPSVKADASFTISSRQQGLGFLALQAEDPGSMERFALAMHLGLSNVRRSRQQAKLSLAQQLYHEKKLSLLKTQHMIELLHKSQEMFFEAGSGQFDDCNAVCMHSGTMRQSLIDVTPFMPVSDFICEYCSCVIIPEEQAQSTSESTDAQAEDHKQQLKREHQKKLQLDDETLMVARDVRVLRQRRKLAEEEAAAAWKKVQEALMKRQRLEVRLAELRTQHEMSTMSRHELEELRDQLQDQVATARKQRDTLQTQLKARQARHTGGSGQADADFEPEEDVRPNRGGGASAREGEAPQRAGKKMEVRKISFGKKERSAQPVSEVAGGGSGLQRKSSFGRVLSFGKKKAAEPPRDMEVAPPPQKKETVAGGLVRKLSFGRKK